MYADILFTSLIISLFCAGLSLITREGYVLYFLRKPFEGLSGIKNELAKPFILCCTCMASFWGIVIYLILNGLPEHIWFQPDGVDIMIICCIISAFLNTLFINLVEKLEA